MMHAAHDYAFKREIIASLFRQCRVWALNTTKLLNVPLPSNVDNIGETLSMDKLDALMQNVRLRIKMTVLN